LTAGYLGSPAQAACGLQGLEGIDGDDGFHFFLRGGATC